MNLIEKMYSFLILLSVIVGLCLGSFEPIRANAEVIIVPLLMLMLYGSFLQIPLQDLKLAIKNRKFTTISLLINFVWTPIFAWILASLFLANHPALWIGFIMLMVTPCTDWYLIFTGIARGNLALSTAILPLNLLLQVVLLPLYLYLFAHHTGIIELHFLLENIMLILFLPFLLALLSKKLIKNIIQFTETFNFLPILFLCFAIAAMFASQGHLLLDHLDLLMKILVPILFFFAINFMIGIQISKRLTFSYPDKVSLTLTTLARNSPIALAIAMTAFPEQPLIALTLIVGPLLELPILAFVTQILLLSKARNSRF